MTALPRLHVWGDDPQVGEKRSGESLEPVWTRANVVPDSMTTEKRRKRGIDEEWLPDDDDDRWSKLGISHFVSLRHIPFSKAGCFCINKCRNQDFCPAYSREYYIRAAVTSCTKSMRQLAGLTLRIATKKISLTILRYQNLD